MSSTNFTAEDLAALEQAIAKGVMRVKYTDKEITYRSLDEMLKIRDIMRNCLGITSNKSLRKVASTNKALC